MRGFGAAWFGFGLAIAVAATSRAGTAPAPALHQRLDGFNVIVADGHPFGNGAAFVALAKARQLGATAIAVVPFFWQANPSSPDLIRRKDLLDDELRAAIRDAHALGLAVLVKPHVWVPDNWAGAVAMTSETDWQTWFTDYRGLLDDVAHIAEEEKADALVVGTELAQTTQRPEWRAVISDARAIYPGPLLYAAHNLDEAMTVPFWSKLDAVGVTLYPPLGADDDRDGWRKIMRAVADGLDKLAARTGKPVIVAEIGSRSAQGAAAKPWESPDQRPAAPDLVLQSDVLADWLAALHRPSIRGVLIWQWLTDPDAGGSADTDFTVQGKPAERVLTCAWTQVCQ